MRELSSCIIEKLSGFEIVRKTCDNKLKNEHTPIDMVYCPGKKFYEIIVYQFNSRGGQNNHKCQKKQTARTYKCHCYFFFVVTVVKNKFKHHLKISSKISSLVSFEDNFKYLGYLPFVTYFDFETTTGSDCINYLDDEEMYPFSDCLIFAFHPKLTIDRTVVVQSFQHTYDELTDVTYLKTEMIDQADPITTNQLRDCVQKVYKKVKEIFATSKIFSCELKFELDCFKKWHAKTY